MTTKLLRRGWLDNCILVTCDGAGCKARIDTGMQSAIDAYALFCGRGWHSKRIGTERVTVQRRNRKGKKRSYSIEKGVFRHWCPKCAPAAATATESP